MCIDDFTLIFFLISHIFPYFFMLETPELESLFYALWEQQCRMALAMTHSQLYYSLSCRGSPHFLPVATLDGQKFMAVQSQLRVSIPAAWCRCCRRTPLLTAAWPGLAWPKPGHHRRRRHAVHQNGMGCHSRQSLVETPWQFYRLGKDIFTRIEISQSKYHKIYLPFAAGVTKQIAYLRQVFELNRNENNENG